MRQIFSAIAEYERALIVLKLRGARERMKVRTGRCEGRKPFGMLPGESDTLAIMRRLRTVEQRTYAQIAEGLNDAGIPTRSGVPWRISTNRTTPVTADTIVLLILSELLSILRFPQACPLYL